MAGFPCSSCCCSTTVASLVCCAAVSTTSWMTAAACATALQLGPCRLNCQANLLAAHAPQRECCRGVCSKHSPPVDVVPVVWVVRLALQQGLHSSLVYVPVPAAVLLLVLLCWPAAAAGPCPAATCFVGSSCCCLGIITLFLSCMAPAVHRGKELCAGRVQCSGHVLCRKMALEEIGPEGTSWCCKGVWYVRD